MTSCAVGVGVDFAGAPMCALTSGAIVVVNIERAPSSVAPLCIRAATRAGAAALMTLSVASPGRPKRLHSCRTTLPDSVHWIS